MNNYYTWLPASKPISDNKLLSISHANGSYLYTTDNHKIYDAISSWWCKPLGHSHPLVKNAIISQLNKFEHHIPVNAINSEIEQLSSSLVALFDNMDKVLYAADGSSAVEIAMKLSIESRIIKNQHTRTKFISLNGGYHGETIFCLSICGIETFKNKYHSILPQHFFINNICYVANAQDPLWNNSNFDLKYWNYVFEQIAPQTTGLIFEPIVQGANGMSIISKDFLINLILLARKFDIHIICDEIMVGLGRLGVFSVTQEMLRQEVDFVCFAKNLTAGAIPMSAVIVNKKISESFKTENQIFMHSHTHSCNALAASVANQYIKWLAKSNIINNHFSLEKKLSDIAYDFANQFSFLSVHSSIGFIIAWKINLTPSIINKIYNIGIEIGIYLRPIKNILYIMPPLFNVEEEIPIIKLMLYKLFKQLSTYIDK